MTRYTLTLPLSANDGRTLLRDHREVRETLCAWFGGCTVMDATGYWPPCPAEDVRVYTADDHGTMAYPAGTYGYADLYAFAAQLARDCDQEGVYITRLDASGLTGDVVPPVRRGGDDERWPETIVGP